MRALLATLRNALRRGGRQPRRPGIADGGDDRQRRRVGRVLGAVLRPRRHPAAAGTATASCCCWPSSPRPAASRSACSPTPGGSARWRSRATSTPSSRCRCHRSRYRAAPPRRADQPRRPRLRRRALRRRRRSRPPSGRSCSSSSCSPSATLLTGFLVLTGSLAFFIGRSEGGELGFHAMLLLGALPGRRLRRAWPRSCSTRSCPPRSSPRCPPRLVDVVRRRPGALSSPSSPPCSPSPDGSPSRSACAATRPARSGPAADPER